MKFFKSVLLLIFFFSGFASLIYQIVWQRMLTLSIGSNFSTITIIVSIYLLGLGIGSIIAGRIIEKKASIAVTFYILIEISIAVFAFLSPLFLEMLTSNNSKLQYPIVFLLAAIFILIPTLLMGATLPIMIEIIKSYKEKYMSNISLLYFVNTLGAAFGAFGASFILITFLGLINSVYIGGIINLSVALSFYLFCRKFVIENGPSKSPVTVIYQFNKNHLYVFVSGLLAIGYEILWFRLNGVITKDSPYAFSAILSVILLGIALGSMFIKYLTDRNWFSGKITEYGWLQLFISFLSLFIIFSFYYLAKYSTTFNDFVALSFNNMIHPPDDFKVAKYGLIKNIYIYTDIIIWPFLFTFIPSFIMGMSFPFINWLSYVPGKESLSTAGIYLFNIIGNVAGGLLTGFVLLPLLNTVNTLIFFSILSLVTFLPITIRSKRSVSLVFAILMIIIIILLPNNFDFYKRIHQKHLLDESSFFIEEGKESVVVTTLEGKKVKNYINGSSHGLRPLNLYTFEVLEAFKFSANVDSILVIGFGIGSTSEAILKNPYVKNIILVELDPNVIKNHRKIPELRKILDDPRMTIIIDDGRRYLNRIQKKFDMIFIDALRSQTAMSNNIHSQNFYKILYNHLKPAGILMATKGASFEPIIDKTIISVFNHCKTYQRFSICSPTFLVENDMFKNGVRKTVEMEMNYSGEKYANYYRGDSYEIPNVNTLPINTDERPNTEYYLWKLFQKK